MYQELSVKIVKIVKIVEIKTCYGSTTQAVPSLLSGEKRGAVALSLSCMDPRY